MHKLAEKIAECLKAKVEGKGIDNIEGADLVELGMWVDIIKDIAEYDKAMREIEEMDEESEGEEEGRMYYRGQPRSKTTGRFMRRGDGRRNNRGRRGYEEPMYFMTPEMYHEYDAEELRDMDRQEGRMYYSGGGSGSSGSQGGSQSGSRGATGGSMGGNSGGSQGSGRSYYNGEGSDGGRDYREGKSGQSRRNYMETKEMNSGNTPGEKQAKMKELENYTKELSEDVTEMISGATAEEKQMLKTKLQTLAQKIS